jgi:primary-amine oxidase
MAAAKEKASVCCRDAPARVAGAPVVPMRAIAASPVGKVVALAAGGGERVSASAAGSSGAVIEEIAAVQPTTAKASSKGSRP